MGATSLYSLSRDAVVANQFIETSQQSNFSDFNIWLYNTTPYIEFSTYDTNFNVWNSLTPIIDIGSNSGASIPEVVIHQYAGGNEFITTGILIENATYTQKFTIKITGDITARQFIEVP